MNNETYIALLKQYREGTISDTDRHILERAALDDPFLFDAMEGYGVHGTVADASALSQLKNSKHSKPGKIRWLTMRKLSVAASLVALLSITFLMKNQLSEISSPEESVAVESNDASDNNAPMAQSFPAVKDGDDMMKLEESEEVKEDELIIEDEEEVQEKDYIATRVRDVNTNKSTTTEVIKETNKPALTPVATIDLQPESTVVADATVDNVGIEEKEAPVETYDIAEASEGNTATKSKRIDEAQKKTSRPEEDAITYADTDDDSAYILGKVLDINGQELIGANVYIENTEIGGISDIAGNFKLPKYERGHQMVISYTGYQDQKVVLGDQNYYQIVLQQNPNLSEVKVTTLKEVDRQYAYPTMGLDEFDTYVKDNLQHPIEVFGSSKSRRVKVGFDVGMNGKLSNFIDKSKNCDECFKEAVRLLEGSGRWETKPFGTPYRTSYIFEF